MFPSGAVADQPSLCLWKPVKRNPSTYFSTNCSLPYIPASFNLMVSTFYKSQSTVSTIPRLRVEKWPVPSQNTDWGFKGAWGNYMHILLWNLSSGSWMTRFTPQLHTLKGHLIAWDCCDVIPLGDFFRLNQCTVLGLLVTSISIRTPVVWPWASGFSIAGNSSSSLVFSQYAGNTMLLLSVVKRPSWKIPVDRKRRSVSSGRKKESKRMIVTIQLGLQVNTIPGFSQELW